MEDTDFNAELTYIAKDIRAIHIDALDARMDFRLKLDLNIAFRFQAIIEKLALALIATNRYSKKSKKEKGKEQKEIGNFKDELKLLSEVRYVNKSGPELITEFNKLFPIHDSLIFAIANENLFKKKITDVQEI